VIDIMSSAAAEVVASTASICIAMSAASQPPITVRQSRITRTSSQKRPVRSAFDFAQDRVHAGK
jgi:hypothetical protein